MQIDVTIEPFTGVIHLKAPNYDVTFGLHPGEFYELRRAGRVNEVRANSETLEVAKQLCQFLEALGYSTSLLVLT